MGFIGEHNIVHVFTLLRDCLWTSAAQDTSGWAGYGYPYWNASIVNLAMDIGIDSWKWIAETHELGHHSRPYLRIPSASHGHVLRLGQSFNIVPCRF